MTSTNDAAEIAAGLTEAQRAAILRAEPDGHLGVYFIRWWQADARTLRVLRRRGLATPVWSGVALNTIGLAVRNLIRNDPFVEPDQPK